MLYFSTLDEDTNTQQFLNIHLRHVTEEHASTTEMNHSHHLGFFSPLDFPQRLIKSAVSDGDIHITPLAFQLYLIWKPEVHGFH